MENYDASGHVAPHGPPARRRMHHAAGSVTLTKLSVGPMDNNCYILLNDAGGGIIIDAADEAERILDAVGDAGIDTIITTHGHRDHWQALAAVARATGARVLHHSADAHLIPVRPHGTISHGDLVSVGTASVRIIHTPGHTDGSVCLLLTGPADDRPQVTTHLFTGDTLFPGGPGKTTDQGQFSQIMASLRDRLFVLDDETWIYPGHGDDTTLGAERDSLDDWQARGW